MDEEKRAKMEAMGNDLQAVCQDSTYTMKKRGVVCHWLYQNKGVESEERSIFVIYYEFDSIDSAKVNHQKLMVKKDLSIEEWEVFRQDDIFPDFFGEELSEIWTKKKG